MLWSGPRDAPEVSIVVLSWNTLDDTATCLEALRQLHYPNKRIIVVDNGSEDGSKEYLRSQPDIRLVDLPNNLGFTGGQLAAQAELKGDYVALVNSDAVVAPDWLGRVVDVARKSPRIGAVGGRAYVWDNNAQPYDATGTFYSYQVIDPWRGYAHNLGSGTEPCDVDSISGAAVLVQLAAIRATGYFDGRFFAYFEETDLFARMKRVGYRIVYEPSAHVWHKIGQSTSGAPYSRLFYMHRNRFLFGLRNFDLRFALVFLAFYVADGIRATLRYLRSRSLDDKARRDSLTWNLRHLARTMRDRRDVQRLGGSYSRELLSRPVTRDVTVAIPCYNHVDYVAEAIESALSQSHPPKSVIVIDDGSTDGSLDVALRYEGRVRVITKPNEGVVSAKNLAIKQIETTWTVFLDADDVLPPEYLGVLTSKAAEGHYDVVYCDLVYIGAVNGRSIAGPFHVSRLLSGNFIHNSALVSTDVLRSVGGFKQEMAAGYEDWELYLSFAEHGARFGYVPEMFLGYRQHEQSTSRNGAALEVALDLHQMVRLLHPKLYGAVWRKVLQWPRACFARVPHMWARVTAEPRLALDALACLPEALVTARKERHRSGFYSVWKRELHLRRGVDPNEGP